MSYLQARALDSWTGSWMPVPAPSVFDARDHCPRDLSIQPSSIRDALTTGKLRLDTDMGGYRQAQGGYSARFQTPCVPSCRVTDEVAQGVSMGYPQPQGPGSPPP